MIAELARKSQKFNENKTQPQQKAKSINKRQNGMTKEKLMNVMTTTNSSSITTKYEKKKENIENAEQARVQIKCVRNFCCKYGLFSCCHFVGVYVCVDLYLSKK